MNIVMISAAYPPDAGGVATHVVNLARGLVRAFNDVRMDVVTLRKPGFPFKKDTKGRLREWKLERETTPVFSGRRVVFESVLRLLLDHWHDLDADLIHAHDFDSLQVGWMLRTAFGTPLVLSVHRAPTEWRHQRYRENAKDAFMEAARVHKLIDQIVVPSLVSKVVLEQQGFSNLTVIPHAISKHLLSFRSDPNVLRTAGVPDNAELIFCPVRADEHKDPNVFVRSAGLLRKRLPNRHLLFLVTSEGGDEEQQKTLSSELKSIAQIHGLEENRDILFTRPFSYGTPLATIYRRARVVVVPSLRESFGQTVLDAFMFAKPVVARNSMALPEIVTNNRNGLLFSTSEELAAQVYRILIDSQLSARLANTAKSFLADRYNVPRMATDYMRLYENVLERARKPNDPIPTRDLA